MLLNLKHERFFAVFPCGYRVSKVIVWLVCGLLLLYNVLAFASILNHERFYIKNDYPGAVDNPFYLSYNRVVPDHINNMEFLPAGFEAGFNHGAVVASAPIFSLLLLLLFALLNHLLFNGRSKRLKKRGF